MSTTHHHHVIWLSIVGAVAVLLLAAVGVGAITYERAYEDRIFPGVHIGPVDVGGLTSDEATARIRAAVDGRLSQGFAYSLDGNAVTFDAVLTAPTDPDLSYSFVDVRVPELVVRAYAVGRDGTSSAQWVTRVKTSVNGGGAIPLEVTVDRMKLLEALAENFPDAVAPMVPPRIVRERAAAPDGATTGAWRVVPGSDGRAFDADAVAQATAVRIATFDPAPVILSVVVVPQPYSATDLGAAVAAFDAAVARAPITLMHGTRRWTVDGESLAGWLILNADRQPALDRAAVATWLHREVAPSVERQARDAQLSFHPTTKRVTKFTPSQEGVGIDRDLLFAQLDAAVFGPAAPLLLLPITVTTPAVALADTNDLGIRELLGLGMTSFKGSPANRRHNIRNGSNLLEGRLIPPGEVFSTVAAVSPFTGGNGYKPELVIKGNRTIPEFGGGMCQVSTTLFRAALAAGLPIIERTNHAYRVPYYEPPVGMDATIYGPKPDFRFRNDTAHHILLTTRIVGDTLEYEFWGTKDGRTVTTSEPEVFNYTQPAAKKIVETTDLEPGKEKCIERAHTGADAKFTYTVTYADGRKEERVFTSHYRPWQAVCLKGVEKLEVGGEKLEAPAVPSLPPPPQSPPTPDPTPLYVD